MTQLFDRIRIVPRPDDFLDRNVGSNGEVFYDQQANTLRLYNGKLTGGTTVITSKNMPEEYLEKNKPYVTNDFFEYAMPLTGGIEPKTQIFV
mgnify:CR=1 FL=1